MRRQLERRRVVGAEVVVGDYFELAESPALWRVHAVKVDGADVGVSFTAIGGGHWKTLLRAGERVHVWRDVKPPKAPATRARRSGR